MAVLQTRVLEIERKVHNAPSTHMETFFNRSQNIFYRTVSSNMLTDTAAFH